MDNTARNLLPLSLLLHCSCLIYYKQLYQNNLYHTYTYKILDLCMLEGVYNFILKNK